MLWLVPKVKQPNGSEFRLFAFTRDTYLARNSRWLSALPAELQAIAVFVFPTP